MGSIVKAPPRPRPPVLPRPAPEPPAPLDPNVMAAREALRKRAQLAGNSTILTSPTGLVASAPTTAKTLLGA